MDEILRRLVATANSSAFLLNEKVEPEEQERKPRKHRLLKLIARLPAEQRKQLVALLAGDAALIVIGGSLYVVRRAAEGHTVYDSEKNIVRTVIGDVCSCEDSRFRQRLCKHVLAVGGL